MEIDARNQRLLAAHTEAGTLSLVDLKTNKPLQPISAGSVQGVAVDTRSDTYILGDAQEHKIVFVSSKTLTVSGELVVNGPVDAIAYDSKNGRAYAGEDDGSHVWVIDIQAKNLVATIDIPGVPEFIVYDPRSDRLYQNIKTKDSVAVINPETNQVEAEWSTLPATGPHGLALDSKSGRLFVAGHNGKLVAIDMSSGKISAQSDIAKGTDQISFDAADRTIYCASKGFVSVVKETRSGFQRLEDVPDHAGTHTLAVDSKRHHIWISYADKEQSYLQRFTQ